MCMVCLTYEGVGIRRGEQGAGSGRDEGWEGGLRERRMFSITELRQKVLIQYQGFT